MAVARKQEDGRCIIRTWSGLDVDLLNPTPELIVIDDIAAALAKINRYGGHSHRPYTVAEHCLLGLEFCTPGTRLEFLLHDASEAYLGDMVGPLKRLSGMQFYRDLEAAWTAAIVERFGLKAKLPAEVKEIDSRLLVTEQRDLCGRRPLSTDKYQPLNLHVGISGHTSDTLRAEFIQAFDWHVRTTPGAKR